ncbi:hypothetical protein [Thioclava indica]|uniref:Uncharacterized protein n=1 Tax=Thioclava indica TaxID=1353528 RepID=A0A074JVQ6_9RHOB|nr:hypothetical protein [Thioclava indica]KEO61771.1 hypothetical protein DT23_02000 [Thioclava indica]
MADMWRALRVSFLAICAGGVLGLGALLWFYPVLAGGICPRCFGLERASPTLYVEAEMSPAARQALIAMTSAAQAQVAQFYPERRAHIRILACATKACNRRLGGRGAAAVTYSLGSLAIVRLAPRGLTETILAHELAHTETHARLGALGQIRHKMPAWFDEGLSVLISDDPRYLNPGISVERCKALPAPELPASPFEWAPRAGRDNGLYAQAACAVLIWAAHQGGMGAIKAGLETGVRFP